MHVYQKLASFQELFSGLCTPAKLHKAAPVTSAARCAATAGMDGIGQMHLSSGLAQAGDIAQTHARSVEGRCCGMDHR